MDVCHQASALDNREVAVASSVIAVQAPENTNMGTFVGHILPGSFTFLFGTWWTFAVWRNYVRSRKKKQRYVCRCSYAVPCLPRKLSVEGIVKIIGSCACILMEYLSIFVLFLLNGVGDVMYNAGFPLPPHTDYATLLLTIASEGLLLHFHLHGRSHLDVVIHTLLVYTVVALVACLLAEMCRPRSVLASLGRAYFALLHGTWLCQIGFILYSPLPDTNPGTLTATGT
ncbi:transmembrane protein 45B-like [Rhipicephalus sanguineus]|uniref:transmembrane protein 45B-like n=1 Tax=Rhipicephalus sanguineus TaxID=34632 RepID=UPI001893C07A|nr:transmembrane protein 45B-like [Rhipicephalus sanguineus]